MECKSCVKSLLRGWFAGLTAFSAKFYAEICPCRDDKHVGSASQVDRHKAQQAEGRLIIGDGFAVIVGPSSAAVIQSKYVLPSKQQLQICILAIGTRPSSLSCSVNRLALKPRPCSRTRDVRRRRSEQEPKLGPNHTS